MVRTREYLKSRFENGDVPTAEDYADLIDSFFHKNEQGEVSEAEEWPVSGKAVYEAIREAIEGLDVAALAPKEWVELQLSAKADEEDVAERLESVVTTEAASFALSSWLLCGIFQYLENQFNAKFNKKINK